MKITKSIIIVLLSSLKMGWDRRTHTYLRTYTQHPIKIFSNNRNTQLLTLFSNSVTQFSNPIKKSGSNESFSTYAQIYTSEYAYSWKLALVQRPRAENLSPAIGLDATASSTATTYCLPCTYTCMRPVLMHMIDPNTNQLIMKASYCMHVNYPCIVCDQLSP